MKTDNSNNMEKENINKYHSKKYPNDMIYIKGVQAEANSKSNISDISGDYLNQYKKMPVENNYIIAGNIFETGSVIGYKNNNNYIMGKNEEDSDQHTLIL